MRLSIRWMSIGSNIFREYCTEPREKTRKRMRGDRMGEWGEGEGEGYEEGWRANCSQTRWQPPGRLGAPKIPAYVTSTTMSTRVGKSSIGTAHRLWAH